MGWLGLVIAVEWCVGIPDIMSGQMYSIPPLMGDPGMFGPPQMGGGKAGQVLTFGPDPSSGLMAPVAFQPPGNIQYASTCEYLNNQNEQFKKCMESQIKDFKAVIENCRKMLGENAKECCVDDGCLNVINRNLNECSNCEDSKACRDEKCQKNIADSIVNNMNTEQFKMLLSDVLKSSLKKIGNKLSGLTSCARDKCERDVLNRPSSTVSSTGPGTRNQHVYADEYDGVRVESFSDNVPAKGVMLVPVEKAKYDKMFGMLDDDVRRVTGSSKPNQRAMSMSDQNRTDFVRDSDYIRRDMQSRNAYDCIGGRSKECVRKDDGDWQQYSNNTRDSYISDWNDDMQYTHTNRPRPHSDHAKTQRRPEFVNESVSRTAQPYRTNTFRKTSPTHSRCTREMCSRDDRHDLYPECTDYCERANRSNNSTAGRTTKSINRSIEDRSDVLASDSCLSDDYD